MKISYFLSLLSLVCLPLLSFAQSETIPTEQGDITLHPVLHASMVMEWEGKTIYFDPYGGAEKYTSFPAPDLILITHLHGDHFNPKTLAGLDTKGAVFIVPQSVREKMSEDLPKQEIKVLANDESAELMNLSVKAVPMYNLPADDNPRHPKGWGNGYVLSIGGKRIYVSGDTEDIPEMRQLEEIDLAFVCMNLPYTMTVEQAASAVLAFQPKAVYPFHFRGKDGFSDVDKFEQIVKEGNQQIEVRRRNWYSE